MGKIFVRERRSVQEGDGQPRFAVVATSGVDLNMVRSRVRRAELDTIAQATGAEVVYLPHGGKEHGNEAPPREHGRGRGRRKGGSA